MKAPHVLLLAALAGCSSLPTAEGDVEILPPSTSKPVKEDWDTVFRTQMDLLASPALAAKTLEALPPEIRAEFEKSPDAAAALAARIEVERHRWPNQVTVTVSNADRQRAVRIVSTHLAQYQKEAPPELLIRQVILR